jgi:hypothetical protein
MYEFKPSLLEEFIPAIEFGVLLVAVDALSQENVFDLVLGEVFSQKNVRKIALAGIFDTHI